MGQYDDDANKVYDPDYDDDERVCEVCCRDCGSTDVYWSLRNGCWVLYGTNSRKHVCDPKVLSEIRLDAFGTLD